RLRQLGVVGEINYQPFDAEGRIVERSELKLLSHRVLSGEGDRLQALARRDDRSVIAIAGGRAKIDAVRGALRGRFVNVLVTDEDCARGLLGRGGSGAGGRGGLLEGAQAPELLVALVDQRVRGAIGQLGEL